MSKLTSFLLEGNALPVTYMETQTVKEGVECDIYTFANDNTKDLAIVRVTKGYKTPLQRILLGAKTIEGYVEGIGTLTVSSADGQVMTCAFGPSDNNESITVEVGQIM